MSKNKIKINFIYNIFYQLLTLLMPLATAPYLSRVIGANGIGIYSYTYSIVYYFVLITLLGVNNYGNRSIAKIKEKKELLSKTFWSIYSMQLIMGGIMIATYLFYSLFLCNRYKIITIIQVLYIISAVLDINWFFFGMEEFKKTVIRNSIVKMGCIILVFIGVKNTSDVWKYTLIMSGMTCISQIVLWKFLKKYIRFEKVSWGDIKKHIRPNLTLFVPVIAISLYKIMDKIMLGLLSTTTEVGYYENAEKIINVPLTIITALGTVMLPRMSNMIAKGNKAEAGKYIMKSIEFVMFMSLAMCFGLASVGYKFALIFYGEEFEKTGLLIAILSTTLPFISFANVIRTQYLIPKEKDKIYITSVILGAIINFTINCVFIPTYKSIGACVGTISAEIIVMAYQAIAIRNELPIKQYLVNSVQFLTKSILMALAIYPLNYIEMNSALRLLIQVGLGCSIYVALNLKYVLNAFNAKIIRKGDQNKRHN